MRYLVLRAAARLAPALIVVLGGCKSGANSVPDLGTGGAPPELAIAGASGLAGSTVSYRLDNSDGGVASLVWARPEDVWKTVLVTYHDLTLTVTSMNSERHQLSSSVARAPRTLGGKPLREYLDCGNGIAGPRVDSYDVSYALVTTVTPADGDSTAVHSTLVATATSRGGTSTAPVDCATTGRLEKRIAQLVALKLGR